MDIKFRPMMPSDLQHVGPLYGDMVEEMAVGEVYPAFPDVEKEKEDFVFFALRMLKTRGATWGGFVAVDGKVAKGFCAGAILQRLVGQPRIYCMGEILYVSPNFRHKGLGNGLVRQMCEWGVASGAGALEVAFKPGTLAHKNWARMGFRTYNAAAVLADGNMKPILDYPQFQVPPAVVEAAPVVEEETQKEAIGE